MSLVIVTRGKAGLRWFQWENWEVHTHGMDANMWEPCSDHMPDAISRFFQADLFHSSGVLKTWAVLTSVLIYSLFPDTYVPEP